MKAVRKGWHTIAGVCLASPWVMVFGLTDFVRTPE